MRVSHVIAALTVGLVLTATGCSRVVDGVAQTDPNMPPSAVTEDGSGVIIGYPDAPARIEVFTEPQCSHCAQLQHDFGDEIGAYINLGQLAVTYRPMVFIDNPGDTDYSARVSNAVFLAAGPGTGGPALQAFVEDLWSHQNPGGEGPSDKEMADMARESGVGSAQVAKISAGEEGVDVQEMADQNVEFLTEIDSYVSTPTVYNLVGDEKVDVYDNNWLSKLLSSV